MRQLEIQSASYTSLTMPVELSLALDDKRKEVAELEARLKSAVPLSSQSGLSDQNNYDTQQTRLEHIREFQDRVAEDLELALQEYILLWQQSQEEQWERSLLNSVQHVKRQLLAQKGNLWKLINEALEEENFSRAQTILQAFEILYADNTRSREAMRIRRISQVLKMVDAPTTSAPSSLKLADVIGDALYFWQTYDIEAREMAVQLLLWATNHEEGEAILRQRFTADDGQQYLYLLNDARLKDIPMLKILSVYSYEIHSPYFQPPDEDEASLSEWLSANMFDFNPFGNHIVNGLPLFARTWAQPAAWNKVHSTAPVILWSKSAEDLRYASQMLAYEISLEKSKTFLVKIQVPELIHDLTNSPDQGLQSLARSCAETWLDILGSQPYAFLDLLRTDQLVLAEFLHWHAGSFEMLKFRLMQRGYDLENSPQRMTLRRLEEDVGELSTSSTVTSRQFLSWLRVRPPGLEHTYLVVECISPRLAAQMMPHLSELFDLNIDPVETNISIKIFLVAESSANFPEVSIEELRWSEESIRKMLQDRLYLASNATYTSMNDFLPLGTPPGADENLVLGANGSLSKLLKMGNDALK